MSARLARLCILLALAPLAAHAQQPDVTANSTLSGKVICADTSAPARFAKVLFKPVGPSANNPFLSQLQKSMAQMQAAQAKSGGAPPPTAQDAAEEKRRLAVANHSMSAATDMLNASTVALDGSYSMSGLKPGAYYVHAVLPGYIDPLSQFTDDELASDDPAVRARIAAAVPTITVSGTDSVHLDLRLERGATLTGRVLYDDGSPAANWTVSAIHPNSGDDLSDATDAMMAQAMAMSGSAASTIARTDDLGNFRIAGLPPGAYFLRAGIIAAPSGIGGGNLRQGGSGINLAVYSGDTFRRTGAKAFTVVAGDTRPGLDITIPEHQLHTISGHVLAQSDSHPLNGGNITLTSKDDPGLHATAGIRDDGSFRFEDMPPGSYTLQVAGAADVHTTGSSKLMGISIPQQETLHKYATGASEVTLGDLDLTGINFNLAQLNWQPPAHKPGAGDDSDAGAALGKLFGAMLSGDDSDDSKSGKASSTTPAPAKP